MKLRCRRSALSRWRWRQCNAHHTIWVAALIHFRDMGMQRVIELGLRHTRIAMSMYHFLYSTIWWKFRSVWLARCASFLLLAHCVRLRTLSTLWWFVGRASNVPFWNCEASNRPINTTPQHINISQRVQRTEKKCFVRMSCVRANACKCENGTAQAK